MRLATADVLAVLQYLNAPILIRLSMSPSPAHPAAPQKEDLLASPAIPPLSTCVGGGDGEAVGVNVIVLCGSSVIETVDLALDIVAPRPQEAAVAAAGGHGDLATPPSLFVITGGVGHSTSRLIDRVSMRASRQDGEKEGVVSLVPEADIFASLLFDKAADLTFASAVSAPLFMVSDVCGENHFVRPLLTKATIVQSQSDAVETARSMRRQRLRADPLPVLLEKESTNCGDNALRTARLLRHWWARTSRRHAAPHPSPPGGEPPERRCRINIQLLQDPTMLRRSALSFSKHMRSLIASVGEEEGKGAVTDAITIQTVPLVLDEAALSAWLQAWMTRQRRGHCEPADGKSGESAAGVCYDSAERLVSLVLGEIPRLRDDAEGYGPRGRSFIDSAGDIPANVVESWGRIKSLYPELLR